MKIALSKKEMRVDPKDVGLDSVEGDLFLAVEKGLYLGRDGIGAYRNCRLFLK